MDLVGEMCWVVLDFSCVNWLPCGLFPLAIIPRYPFGAWIQIFMNFYLVRYYWRPLRGFPFFFPKSGIIKIKREVTYSGGEIGRGGTHHHLASIFSAWMIPKHTDGGQQEHFLKNGIHAKVLQRKEHITLGWYRVAKTFRNYCVEIGYIFVKINTTSYFNHSFQPVL